MRNKNDKWGLYLEHIESELQDSVQKIKILLEIQPLSFAINIHSIKAGISTIFVVGTTPWIFHFNSAIFMIVAILTNGYVAKTAILDFSQIWKWIQKYRELRRKWKMNYGSFPMNSYKAIFREMNYKEDLISQIKILKIQVLKFDEVSINDKADSENQELLERQERCLKILDELISLVRKHRQSLRPYDLFSQQLNEMENNISKMKQGDFEKKCGAKKIVMKNYEKLRLENVKQIIARRKSMHQTNIEEAVVAYQKIK